MKIIEIEGARKLSGTIRVSGAKNATVALIPAAILTDEEATICNVPEITDTDALCDILKLLKVKIVIYNNIPRELIASVIKNKRIY